MDKKPLFSDIFIPAGREFFSETSAQGADQDARFPFLPPLLNIALAGAAFLILLPAYIPSWQLPVRFGGLLTMGSLLALRLGIWKPLRDPISSAGYWMGRKLVSIIITGVFLVFFASGRFDYRMTNKWKLEQAMQFEESGRDLYVYFDKTGFLDTSKGNYYVYTRIPGTPFMNERLSWFHRGAGGLFTNGAPKPTGTLSRTPDGVAVSIPSGNALYHSETGKFTFQ